MFKIEVGGSDSMHPGDVHLDGLSAYDHNTLCGYSRVDVEFEDHDGPATCEGCITALREARSLVRQLSTRARRGTIAR